MSLQQSRLNAELNDTILRFAASEDVAVETVLDALDDAKSDAPDVLGSVTVADILEAEVKA